MQGKAYPTKLQKIEMALFQPGGASLVELRRITGWQAHSVRGAIFKCLKGKKGLAIVSERISEGRRYSILGGVRHRTPLAEN